MKKFISGLLAAVLCAGLSVSAFAAPKTISGKGNDVITFSDCLGTQEETFVVSENSGSGWKDVTKKATVYLVALNSTADLSKTLWAGTGYAGHGSVWLKQNDKGVYVTEMGGPSDIVTFHDKQYLFKVMASGESFWCRVSDGAPAAPAKAEAAKPAAPVTPAATATPAATEAAAPATRVAVGGDQLYTVAMGDTFGVLALNYFGDMNVWRGIYNYNIDAIEAAPNKQIFDGMEILIPHAIQHGEKIFNAIAPASASGNEKLYTVAANDTYGSIAQAHFGDASRYEEIFNRNADRLVDLNTLYAGQVIVLP